jgi:hypothetical protein
MIFEERRAEDRVHVVQSPGRRVLHPGDGRVSGPEASKPGSGVGPEPIENNRTTTRQHQVGGKSEPATIVTS